MPLNCRNSHHRLATVGLGRDSADMARCASGHGFGRNCDGADSLRTSVREARGNTYTMVFSRRCEPVRRKCLLLRTVSTPADLITEAEALWEAEQPQADTRSNRGRWGCVALLCNPEREIPEDLLRAWAERVEREPNYGHVSQTQEEGCLLATMVCCGLIGRVVEGGAPVVWIFSW